MVADRPIERIWSCLAIARTLSSVQARYRCHADITLPALRIRQTRTPESAAAAYAGTGLDLALGFDHLS